MTFDNQSYAAWSDATTAIGVADDPLPKLPAYLASTEPLGRGGTFFDERVDLRDPEGSALTEAIMLRLDEVEDRRKALRDEDRENRIVRVRRLAANAVRCFYHRSPSRMAYSRKADAPFYEGKASWLRGTSMAATVDLMERASLLEHQLGSRGSSSTFAVTDLFVSLVKECGISRGSLTKRLPRNQLIRLYTSYPEHKPHAFDHDGETEGWTAQLELLNDFLAQQDIAVQEVSDEWQEWLDRLNAERRRGGASYVYPELLQTDLYRSFNNSSFEEGGRLYGGWWINAPGAVRRRITINGSPTVELDYSSHHLRILYNKRGLSPSGDLYRLETVARYEAQQGELPDTYRPCVKALTQALINCGPKGRPHQIELRPDEAPPAAISPEEIVRMIEARHQPITEDFRSAIGLRLQREDSDLTLDIISTLREQGIVTLPIHDSFIVAKQHEAALRGHMIAQYCKRFGFEPIVGER